MAKMTADDWLVEIDNALEYRRLYAREDSWISLEKSFLHDPTGNTAIGENLIFGMGDALQSDLAVPDPEYIINPTHPNGVDRAPVVEYVDNWIAKMIEIKDHVDIGILNSYLKSRAIIKIGYDSQFGYNPYFDAGQGGQQLGLTFTQFNKRGERIEPMNTKPGMPWAMVVDPVDFVVPWGTLFLEHAPWAAHRIIRKNKHIKDDPKYKNTSNLEPQISMEDFMGTYTKTNYAKRKYKEGKAHIFNANLKPEFNVLWEIRDRMTGRIIVVSPDYDKFLRNDFDALQIAGMPFVSSTFVNHTRSFWSTPLAYYLKQIQRTQFDISLQSEKQRRINNLKFLADKNAMSPAEATKLISGDTGTIGWTDTSRPLKDVFVPFPTGNLIDFVMQANHNRQNAREVIGYGRNQLGDEMQSTRRTAREVSAVQAGSQKRTGKRGSSIIRLYIDTIRKINKICFRYWKVPRYAMVNNEWVKFTGEELEGEYLYDVSLTMKRAVGKAERKAEAMMMMFQLMQIPGINLQAAFKYIVDASGDPAFERILGASMGGGNRQMQQSQQPQLPGGQT